MFKLQSLYTRKQIHKLIGGDLQSYLPHRGGRVVCGCFKTDNNPNAPKEILVGDRVNVVKYARVFAGQVEPIPVFIKQTVNQWKYIGNYQAVKYTEEPKEVSAKAKAAGRMGVAGVLYHQSAKR
jgi:hypothetical protein